MPPTTPLPAAPPVLRRARAATASLFLLFGLALGAWTVRVPAIKHAVGASDGWLGVALLGLAAGSIVGMQAAGRLVERYGASRVMVPVAFAEGILLLPMAWATNVAWLAAALFVFGLNHGTLNIVMNANGIEVQTAYGRPILASFHAIYSIGGLAGAGVGGLFAQAGASPLTTFAAVAVICIALAAFATGAKLDSTVDQHADDGGPRSAGTPARPGPVRLHGVLILGTLVFCALVGEGAAADWSAVYLRDNLGTSAGFAAWGYAAFAIAMTAARLVGDRLAMALGPVRLVRASGLLAAVGLGGALLINAPWAGVAGFACLGAGVACVAPQANAAAAAKNPTRSGPALARVLGIGYAGFLTGPILIGALSTQVKLPAALSAAVALCLLVVLAAPALSASRTGSPGIGERVTSPQ